MSLDWTIVRDLPRGTVIRLTQEHDAYPDFGIAPGALLVITEHYGTWDFGNSDSFLFAQLLHQSAHLVKDPGDAVHWQNVIQFRVPDTIEEAHEWPLGAEVVTYPSNIERGAALLGYHLGAQYGEAAMIEFAYGRRALDTEAALRKAHDDLKLGRYVDLSRHMLKVYVDSYLPLYREREEEIIRHRQESALPPEQEYEVLISRSTLFKLTVPGASADEAIERAMMMAADLSNSDVEDIKIGRSDEFKALVRKG